MELSGRGPAGIRDHRRPAPPGGGDADLGALPAEWTVARARTSPASRFSLAAADAGRSARAARNHGGRECGGVPAPESDPPGARGDDPARPPGGGGEPADPTHSGYGATRRYRPLHTDSNLPLAGGKSFRSLPYPAESSSAGHAPGGTARGSRSE